jgi:putative addiction module component (TIGR02574 family)
MQARTKKVLDMALQLSFEEQEELLSELAGRLSVWDQAIERAWAEEATRRWAGITSGEVQTVPWSAVRQGLKQRFGV